MGYIGGLRSLIQTIYQDHADAGGLPNVTPKRIWDMTFNLNINGRIYNPQHIDISHPNYMVIRTDWQIPSMVSQYPASLIVFNESISEVSYTNDVPDIDTSIADPVGDVTLSRQEILENIHNLLQEEHFLAGIIEIASMSGLVFSSIYQINTDDPEVAKIRYIRIPNPPIGQEVVIADVLYPSILTIAVPAAFIDRVLP